MLHIAVGVFLPAVWIDVTSHGQALLPGVSHSVVNAVGIAQLDHAAMPGPPAAFAELGVQRKSDASFEALRDRRGVDRRGDHDVDMVRPDMGGMKDPVPECTGFADGV